MNETARDYGEISYFSTWKMSSKLDFCTKKNSGSDCPSQLKTTHHMKDIIRTLSCIHRRLCLKLRYPTNSISVMKQNKCFLTKNALLFFLISPALLKPIMSWPPSPCHNAKLDKQEQTKCKNVTPKQPNPKSGKKRDGWLSSRVRSRRIKISTSGFDLASLSTLARPVVGDGGL